MRYEIMKDYEVESLKREISKSLSSGDSSAKSVSDARRHIESAVQELRRALSSLERNTDSRIRELQQSASSSSRSFSSYSSYESGIRNARREADRAVSEMTNQLRNLPENRSYGYGYSSSDADRKLDKLVEALKKANAELLSTNRRVDDLANEKGLAEKKALEKERKLQSELQEANRKADRANAEAMAVAAEMSESTINAANVDSDTIISRLKKSYEVKILLLQKELASKKHENSLLLNRLSMMRDDRSAVQDQNPKMNRKGFSFKWLVVSGLLLIAGALFFAYCGSKRYLFDDCQRAFHDAVHYVGLDDSQHASIGQSENNILNGECAKDECVPAKKSGKTVPGDNIAAREEAAESCNSTNCRIQRFIGCEIGHKLTDYNNVVKLNDGSFFLEKQVALKPPFSAFKKIQCFFDPDDARLYKVVLASNVFTNPDIAKMKNRLKEISEVFDTRFGDKVKMSERENGYVGVFNVDAGQELSAEIVDGKTKDNKNGKMIRIMLVDHELCRDTAMQSQKRK